MPLEKSFVGQDRYRLDSGARIIFRDRDRLERLDNHPGRGRRLFYFGDKRQLFFARVEGGSETAEVISQQRGPMPFIAPRPEPFDLLAFHAQNFLEPIHFAFCKAESCRLHAPARMACSGRVRRSSTAAPTSAGVAQLVAPRFRKTQVTGSIP